MVGIGTVINAAAIVAGGACGLLAGAKLPARLHRTLTQVAGLVSIGVGLQMFLSMRHIVIVLPSLFLGALVGEGLHLEQRMDRLAAWLKRTTKTTAPHFQEAFVTTSLLYCVGPLAILGPLADGLSGQLQILLTKSLLDGTVAIGFAAAMGVGVLFSALSVAAYQGAITLLGVLFGHFVTELMMAELTATGGILILAIGINVIELLGRDRRIPVGNLLPALLFSLLFAAWYPG